MIPHLAYIFIVCGFSTIVQTTPATLCMSLSRCDDIFFVLRLSIPHDRSEEDFVTFPSLLLGIRGAEEVTLIEKLTYLVFRMAQLLRVAQSLSRRVTVPRREEGILEFETPLPDLRIPLQKTWFIFE